MKRVVIPGLVAFLGVCAPAFGQGGHEHGAHEHHGAGEPLKGLSGGRIEGLREGQGMGLARAAELNGYPGPLHVLELTDELDLSEAQHARAEALYEAMHEEAVAVGEEILAAERDLEALFADGEATRDQVAAHTDRLGALHGRLRGVHLGYHVKMAEVLSGKQVEAYYRHRP